MESVVTVVVEVGVGVSAEKTSADAGKLVLPAMATAYSESHHATVPKRMSPLFTESYPSLLAPVFLSSSL